jgi:hypothetical protein
VSLDEKKEIILDGMNFYKKTWMESKEKDDWWMMGELFRVENEIDEN